MTKRFLEQLAAIEHERWVEWQKYLHAQTCLNLANQHVIRDSDWNRWERIINIPYENSPEWNKQYDREQVMRYWPVIVTFVADWLGIEGAMIRVDDGLVLAGDIWRKEMNLD